MVNYYIYAKDVSGSTGGSSYYHQNGMKTLEEFIKDVDNIEKELMVAEDAKTESKIIYLHWDDKCVEVDEKKTRDAYMAMRGGGCTEPDEIITWIKNHYDICGEGNKIKLLYIITDGLISSYSAQKCLTMNENMYYEKVVFHALNQNPNEIDLSVAASFLKGKCVTYSNYFLHDDVNISAEFDYDTINVDNFDIEKENLISYIKLKFINTVTNNGLALQEIDKLKKLRNRLFNDLLTQPQPRENTLDTMDKNQFLSEFVKTQWYKNLNASETGTKIDIEKFISTLINYIVSEKKSYSFDALKFDANFSKPIKEEPIVEVDVNFSAEQEIEFPDIILDDEKGIPVIILTDFSLLDKIIFHTTKESAEVSLASFNKFKSTMECPLFLMNDPDVSESIGYFYTLNVYKQLLENTNKTEPRTRRPFHGGLVLTDTDEFDKYNDYILSATYFDSKKINYNIGLFYFVLWKNCQNKEWMDKNVVEVFKKYVLRRISATVCRIGLSSLPLDPTINTTLPTALWYCVELSSRIFKDDPQHFMHERLRMYYGIAHSMIEILKYLKYNLNLVFINNRKDIIRHVMILKKIPTRKEKIHFLLGKIFKNVNGFLVSEFDKPSNLNKLNYLKYNHKDMFNEDVLKEKVYLNQFVNLLHFTDDTGKSEDGKGLIEVCEKTFRPFFTVDQNKCFYAELLKNTKQVTINNDGDIDKIELTYEPIDSLEFDKIFSRYNLFINCVKRYKKYPTFPEYIEYILNKKKYFGDLITIFPPNVYVGAEEVYSRYQDIVTKVDVKQFIEVCKNHVNRSDRIKAEEIVTFTSDIDLDKFITNEDLNARVLKLKDGWTTVTKKIKKANKTKKTKQTQSAPDPMSNTQRKRMMYKKGGKPKKARRR